MLDRLSWQTNGFFTRFQTKKSSDHQEQPPKSTETKKKSSKWESRMDTITYVYGQYYRDEPY